MAHDARVCSPAAAPAHHTALKPSKVGCQQQQTRHVRTKSMRARRTPVVVALVLLLAAASAHATARPQPPRNDDAASDAAAATREAAAEVSSQFLEVVRALFGGGGGGDSSAHTNDDPPTTVAELAEHAPGNMSMLVDGVERVGLHTAIADPNFEATIFAPTNWAFEVALVKLKITPKDLWGDKTALTNILSYHTVPGKALGAGDLKDGQQLTTWSKHQVTVKVDKVAGTLIQGASDTAKVLAADISAGKAIIHVIDTVLIPPAAPSAQQ